MNNIKQIIAAALAFAMSLGVAGAEVFVSQKQDGIFKKVEIRLVNEAIISNNATSGAAYASTTLGWKFDEGQQTLIGAVCDLDLAFSSSEPAAGSGLDVSIGVAATADATLNGAEVTIIPSTDIDPFTNSTTDVEGEFTTVSVQDGTTAAKSVIINMQVDDADVSGIVTGALNGIIEITYTENGDI